MLERLKSPDTIPDIVTNYAKVYNMKDENIFKGKDVIVQQMDNYCKYGKLVKSELHGIWLATPNETTFITYNNIKTIKLNPDPHYKKRD